MTSSAPEKREFLPLTPAVFHILLALADRPLHGYGIMLAVGEAAPTAHKMGPGTVYGSLQRMETAGLVEERGAAEGEKRRLFGITALGRATLEAEAARLASLARLARTKGLIKGEA